MSETQKQNARNRFTEQKLRKIAITIWYLNRTENMVPSWLTAHTEDKALGNYQTPEDKLVLAVRKGENYLKEVGQRRSKWPVQLADHSLLLSQSFPVGKVRDELIAN
jgi:hypothetical protein